MADDKQVGKPSELEQRAEPPTAVEEKVEVDDTPSGTGSVDAATESGKCTDKTTDPEASDATSGIEMALETPAGTPSATEEKPLPGSETALTDAKNTPPHKKQTLGGVIRKILSPNKKDKAQQDEDSTIPKEKGKSRAKSFLGGRFKACKSPPQKSSSEDTAPSVAAEELPKEPVEEKTGEPSEVPKEPVEEKTGEPSDELPKEPVKVETSAPSDLETSPSGVADPSSQKKSQKGFGSKLKKSLTSMAGFFSGNKGGATSAVSEEVGLVSDAETGAIPVETANDAEAEGGQQQTTTVTITSVGGEDEDMERESESTPKFQPFWAEGRPSYQSQTDATLTQLTDIPSVSSDVFASEGDSSSNKDLAIDKHGPKSGSTASGEAVSDKMKPEEPSGGEAVSQDTETEDSAACAAGEKSQVECQAGTPAEAVMQMEDSSGTTSSSQEPNMAETAGEALMQVEDSSGTSSSSQEPNMAETAGEALMQVEDSSGTSCSSQEPNIADIAEEASGGRSQ